MREKLFEKYVRGELTEPEKRRLLLLLRSGREARRFVLKLQERALLVDALKTVTDPTRLDRDASRSNRDGSVTRSESTGMDP